MKSIAAILFLALNAGVGAFSPVVGGNSVSISCSIDLPKIILQSSSNNNDNNDGTWIEEDSSSSSSIKRRNLIINVATAGLLAATGVASWQLYQTEVYTPSGFQRLPVTQFIAALGDPTANQGNNAQEWGLWKADPGPRGVFLSQYESDLLQKDNVAPRGWKFDPQDFWIEEHGIIMESPQFPLPPGRYLVTGFREVTTGLTVNKDGSWKLDGNAQLGQVTHLPCRSARYQPLEGSGSSPAKANPRDFPVKPGAIMPEISGTQKQDYAVLFLIGKAV